MEGVGPARDGATRRGGGRGLRPDRKTAVVGNGPAAVLAGGAEQGRGEGLTGGSATVLGGTG
jgi:hypothetical protein